MGKKGFTLVELLAVIALLAIVIVIAVPSIGGVINSINNNMLEEKIAIIEEAATLFGQDMRNVVINSNTKYKGYSCQSIIVSELVEKKYLDKDNENECLTSGDTGTVGCIVDPSDKNNYLDKKEVVIYYRSKRIYAVVDIDNKLQCS